MNLFHQRASSWKRHEMPMPDCCEAHEYRLDSMAADLVLPRNSLISDSSRSFFSYGEQRLNLEATNLLLINMPQTDASTLLPPDV